MDAHTVQLCHQIDATRTAMDATLTQLKQRVLGPVRGGQRAARRENRLLVHVRLDGRRPEHVDRGCYGGCTQLPPLATAHGGGPQLSLCQTQCCSFPLRYDSSGFAVKLYTKKGKWDIVGNNILVFFIQDAIKFPDLVHAVKQEPDRGFPQAPTTHDNFWDIISLTPESMRIIMWIMSDRTIPRSFPGERADRAISWPTPTSISSLSAMLKSPCLFFGKQACRTAWMRGASRSPDRRAVRNSLQSAVSCGSGRVRRRCNTYNGTMD
jgi:Catalase